MEFYLSFQMGRITGIGAVTDSWQLLVLGGESMGSLWPYGFIISYFSVLLSLHYTYALEFFKQGKSPWDIMIHVGINYFSCKRYKAFFRDLSSPSVQNACNSTFWNCVWYRLHGNISLGNPEPIRILDHRDKVQMSHTKDSDVIMQLVYRDGLKEWSSCRNFVTPRFSVTNSKMIKPYGPLHTTSPAFFIFLLSQSLH